jgi:DNA-directed RNA polymerase specialized sigma24 family protein
VRTDEGFARLYAQEFGTVFRAVFLLCGDRVAAEDATQEAFARALERWKRLRDQSWAAGWVATTALNVARRALRRRPEPGTLDAVPAPGPENSLDLWRAIRKLPRRQQEAVVLHYVFDLSVAEAGHAMGCEEGTVKSHLARAREAMRGQLEEVHDDG